jgi:Bacteriophytochrome (light-regulated signal transduction histidine kinase)
MKTDVPGEHLLVVDDEEPHLRALCDTLGAHGFSVTGHTSPTEALKTLRERRGFALVLTDLMMPEMNGIALLHAAREIDPHVVGVMMTGHATVATAVSAMKEGALDYIQKPFKLSALIPVISRALDIRRLRLENEALQKRLRDRTRELEAANAELESFSYSVSHDLRAPLRTIDGYVFLLLESLGVEVPEEARQHADKVRQGVARMNELIEDLLRLARTSQRELHRERIDLSELARKVAAQLQASAPARAVEWRIAPGLFADADPGLARVVLENLLSNAWKYTGKVPTACIEMGSEQGGDGEPVFFVRDNGAGFDMRRAEQLFTPFRRLHSEQEFPGTGVGLATVQRIIRRHGGRIWGEAEPGRGATFRFTFPRT